MGTKVRQLLLGLAMGGGGALFGYAIARLGAGSVADTPLWALVAALVAGPVIAVAVHELGHLAAGVLNGMRPVLYLVGPVQLEWRDGTRAWSVNRSVAMAGGVTVCLPPGGRFVKSAMSWYVAGGPIASVLLAAAAFLGGLAAPGPWQAPLHVLGMFSAAIALVTGIPLPGTMTNDATRFRMIRADDAGGRRWMAMTTLTGLDLAGVRPREWPAELVAVVAEDASGSATDLGGGWTLAYYAFRDRGDTREAARAASKIRSVMDDIPAAIRIHFEREVAAFDLGRGELPPGLDRLAEPGRRGLMEEGWELPRMLARAHALRGETDAAVERAEDAIDALRTSRSPGTAAMIREEMEALRQACRAPYGAASS